MYTRQELISICERAFVPQEKWRNRDSSMSQTSLGECYALLKAGCHFQIKTTENEKGSNCVTDERTIWIQFWVHDFSYFEGYHDDPRGNASSDFHFYLPTEKRLNEVNGADWY